MLSQRLKRDLFQETPQTKQPAVQLDEDGDVIMQDAPGANPDEPLLEQWERQYNGMRR